MPKLRFPEFCGDDVWNEMPLDGLSKRIRRKVGSKELTPVSITAGFGFVDQTKKFGRRIAGEQYKNYIHIQRGDFVYNKGNSKTFAQGCIYQLKEFEEAAASTAFICFKLNASCVDIYFQNLFECNTHGRKLLKFITSGARSDGLLNINPTDFFSIELPLPPRKEEQQRIAECLSAVDEVIAAQARKLDALKSHKKGLMQELFPREGETQPRLRFPEFQDAPEWGEKKLGNIVEIRSGYSPSKYVLSTLGKYPFVKVEDLNNCTKYQADSRKYCDDSYGAVPRSSVIFPKRGASIELNKIRITTCEILIDTNLMAISPDGTVTTEFLYYFLMNMGLAQIADTSTIPQINNKHIIPFKILIPSKCEQQRIASCLGSLDDLITAESEKLKALKTHKKGLMQQLFPSPEEEV